MLLAERKLHTVAQRAALARAIIVPKLLYVARHAYPTAAERDAAQLVIINYIWASLCSDQRRRGRAWISGCVARLSERDGSLGVPDLRSELQLLGIRALLRWNGLLWMAARVATTLLIVLALPGRLYESTSGPHCTLQALGSGCRPGLGGTIWVTGFRALCFVVGGVDAWTFEHPVPPEWIAATRLQDASRIGLLLEDVAPVLRRDSTLVTIGDALLLLDATRHWMTGGRPGPQLPATTIVALCRLEAAVKAIGWTRGTQQEWDWCLRPHPMTDDSTAFTWCLDQRDPPRLEIVHWTGTSVPPGPQVESTRELRAQTRRADDRYRPEDLLPHPLTSRIVLYNRLPSPTAKHARHRLRLDDPRKGTTAIRERRQRHESVDSDYTTTVSKILATHWRRGVTPLGPTDREFWYRMYHQALVLWTTDAAGACREPTCSNTRATLAHALWDCPLAQAVWRRVLSDWGSGPMTAWKHAVLTGVLAEPPMDYWPLLLDPLPATRAARLVRSPMDDIADGDEGLAATWLVTCTSTLRLLRARRFAHDVRAGDPGAAAIYFAVHTTTVRRLRTNMTAIRRLDDSRLAQARCLARVVNALALHKLPRAPATSPDGQDRWLLTFDGGSRGNPGAGGAGCALIRLTSTGATLKWCAAYYLPESYTTNNMAEIRGLLEGLRQAWRMRLRKLDVIGDSALILCWMRERRQPKTPHLRKAYTRARHWADRLAIGGWWHYRTANKLADTLANLDMHDRRSTSTIRHCADHNYQHRPDLWKHLQSLVNSDIDPWRRRHTYTLESHSIADGTSHRLIRQTSAPIWAILIYFRQ